MRPNNIPIHLRLVLEKKIRDVESKYGTKISDIAESLLMTTTSPWHELCDIVVLKHSLGYLLTREERLVIAARGLMLNHQLGGFEAFIESEECDYWKYLQTFLIRESPTAAGHFGKLMSISGREFSTNREERLDELARFLDKGNITELIQLEESFRQTPYPSVERLIMYIINSNPS